MKYFFIDFENVNDAGFKGYEHLSKEDIVTIFYSENARKIDMRILQPLFRNVTVFFMECQAGAKNAVDHQLASYLGYSIAQHPKEEFYIVSADSAFVCTAKFWHKIGHCVKRISCISDAFSVSNAPTKSSYQKKS